jgi:hypothetical protein
MSVKVTIAGLTLLVSKIPAAEVAEGDVLVIDFVPRLVKSIDHSRYGAGVNEVHFHRGPSLIVTAGRDVVDGQRQANWLP